jgi:signal transduction histidine kinase
MLDPALLDRLANLAREVESLKGNLEHAQRLAALGTIAGIIAHEFNNILTPVMSYAQMALASPHDRPLLLKAVQKAYEGSDRAAQIASAILGFARSEFGGLSGGGPTVDSGPDQGAVDVGAAVHGALSCLARDPSRDGIRLTIDVPEGLMVKMRPIALQQVLLNLILNARRAMAGSRTGGSLTIRASIHPGRPVPGDGAVVAESSTWNTAGDGGGGSGGNGSGEWVTICVRDTGHGLSAEQLRLIFKNFATGEASRGGTGLGLTVCQRLLADAQGGLWCSSQVSVGTEFTITLPRA